MSRITCTSRSSVTSRSILFKSAMKSAAVWDLRRSVMTLPVATSRAANRVQGAVADVVVGGLLRGGGQHRQDRCGPVERLDLRLLVDGVDRGRDRWGQVRADQVADLLDQVRIGRDLELVLSPGLEPEGTPDLTDGLSADRVPLGHRPGRPVCGVLGCGLQRPGHDGPGDLVADRARRDRPRCAGQPLQPLPRRTGGATCRP